MSVYMCTHHHQCIVTCSCGLERGSNVWSCVPQYVSVSFPLVPDIQYGYNRTQFLDVLDRLVDFWRPLLSNQSADDAFHAVDYNYSPWPYIDDLNDNRAAYIHVISYHA